MRTNETEAFRALLKAKQAQLSDGREFRETLAVEATPDELDRIQQASDRDLAVGSLQRNSSQLRDIHAALGRIDAGTYGICAGCDEPINPKRLAAVPSALCCIACQSAMDLGLAISPSGIDLSFLMAA